MTALLTTLVVTVIAGGGPPGADGRAVLENGKIRVSQHGALVAKSEDGHVKLHLRPGQYNVKGLLADEAGKSAKLCEAVTVRLRRGRTTRLKLYCSIK
jgi:hypothetical protein